MKRARSIVLYIGIWCLRIVISILNICPIHQKRILLYSFNGKKYSCNPRHISDELLKTNQYEIYWAFKEPEKYKEKLSPGIKTVKIRTIQYYYLAKTSKVVIFNVQGYGELAKRKGQVFIQTWHASNGYKKVGNFKGIERKINLLGHRDYSYVMSGANSMTERRIRGSMGFKGTVLPGTPRMDILINSQSDETRDRIKKELHISSDCCFLLYAPTWRNDRSSEHYSLDYMRLYNVLCAISGREWVIAVRFHPNVKERKKIDDPHVVDVTDYPEMQDLLYTADMLISDYSSCIWDYSFTYRPCFLYCYDLDDYYSEKSFDIPIEQWRFPIAKNIDELIRLITDFDKDEFKKQMEKHHQEMGSLEDGHATERVCDLIAQIINA